MYSEMFPIFMLQHAKQILPYLLSVLRGLPTAEWQLGPQRTNGYSGCYCFVLCSLKSLLCFKVQQHLKHKSMFLLNCPAYLCIHILGFYFRSLFFYLASSIPHVFCLNCPQFYSRINIYSSKLSCWIIFSTFSLATFLMTFLLSLTMYVTFIV